MRKELIQGVVRLGGNKNGWSSVSASIGHHGLDCFDGGIRFSGTRGSLDNCELLGNDSTEAKELRLI